jgi:predicted nucleotidyltransferase
MDQVAVLNVIERFRNALELKGVRSSRVVLYGSHARDGATQGSDIDLVVISDDFRGKTFWERIDILTDAIYEVMEPIEATAMTLEEWERGDSMICEFARNGRMIPV